uniref:(California timema) hypothetical protein n=1 Tax=Timema californicum TaxID=61474 RepID=A0A7R9J3Z6_TIMCA|nr:unnamed protein product [Timema californicum]
MQEETGELPKVGGEVAIIATRERTDKCRKLTPPTSRQKRSNQCNLPLDLSYLYVFCISIVPLPCPNWIIQHVLSTTSLPASVAVRSNALLSQYTLLSMTRRLSFKSQQPLLPSGSVDTSGLCEVSEGVLTLPPVGTPHPEGDPLAPAVPEIRMGILGGALPPVTAFQAGAYSMSLLRCRDPSGHINKGILLFRRWSSAAEDREIEVRIPVDEEGRGWGYTLGGYRTVARTPVTSSAPLNAAPTVDRRPAGLPHHAATLHLLRLPTRARLEPGCSHHRQSNPLRELRLRPCGHRSGFSKRR